MMQMMPINDQNVHFQLIFNNHIMKIIFKRRMNVERDMKGRGSFNRLYF